MFYFKKRNLGLPWSSLVLTNVHLRIFHDAINLHAGIANMPNFFGFKEMLITFDEHKQNLCIPQLFMCIDIKIHP